MRIKRPSNSLVARPVFYQIYTNLWIRHCPETNIKRATKPPPSISGCRERPGFVNAHHDVRERPLRPHIACYSRLSFPMDLYVCAFDTYMYALVQTYETYSICPRLTTVWPVAKSDSARNIRSSAESTEKSTIIGRTVLACQSLASCAREADRFGATLSSGMFVPSICG